MGKADPASSDQSSRLPFAEPWDGEVGRELIRFAREMRWRGRLPQSDRRHPAWYGRYNHSAKLLDSIIDDLVPECDFVGLFLSKLTFAPDADFKLLPPRGGASQPLPKPGPKPEATMTDWRTFDADVYRRAGGPMAEEMATYAERLEDLIAHDGQYVLIKGREVIGIFASLDEALDAGAEKFGSEPALIKQIVGTEAVYSSGALAL